MNTYDKTYVNKEKNGFPIEEFSRSRGGLRLKIMKNMVQKAEYSCPMA